MSNPFQKNNKNKPFIQDIKNLQQNAPSNHPLKDHTKVQQPTHTRPSDLDELKQLKQALQESLDQNDSLRDQVAELEAYLAEAGDRIEKLETFIVKSNRREVPKKD